MHPLLRQDDKGEIVIHWPKFFRALPIVLACWLAGAMVGQYLSGKPFQITRLLSLAIGGVTAILCWLHILKCRAAGKSPWHFSLAALFAAMTIVCVWLGLASWEWRSEAEAVAKRERLQAAITEIVGQGTVHLSGATLIQVKRRSFSDDDLRQILKLRSALGEIGVPLWIIDLTGTSVTDSGVAELAAVESLEYCYLGQTAITDASLRALGKLPKLKALQVPSTAVTPGALVELSRARPQLDLEPKPIFDRRKNSRRSLTE
jgi:hypothetical protein